MAKACGFLGVLEKILCLTKLFEKMSYNQSTNYPQSNNTESFFSKLFISILHILRHNTLYKNMRVTLWTERIFYHAKKIVLALVKDARKQTALQNIT